MTENAVTSQKRLWNWLRDWRNWYGMGVLIWLMMVMLALFLPNPRVDTDVTLLPVVVAEWLPFFILASVIFIVVGSMLRRRIASVVLSLVLGGLGLIIILTLIGPAIGAWYGYDLVSREANIYRFDTVNERITYECERWLLSCDVIEREDNFG